MRHGLSFSPQQYMEFSTHLLVLNMKHWFTMDEIIQIWVIAKYALLIDLIEMLQQLFSETKWWINDSHFWEMSYFRRIYRQLSIRRYWDMKEQRVGSPLFHASFCPGSLSANEKRYVTKSLYPIENLQYQKITRGGKPLSPAK